MNKSRLWIILSLILLFAAGMVAGIFADKWFLSKKADARRNPGNRPPTLEFWTKELGLTVEQQAKPTISSKACAAAWTSAMSKSGPSSRPRSTPCSRRSRSRSWRP